MIIANSTKLKFEAVLKDPYQSTAFHHVTGLTLVKKQDGGNYVVSLLNDIMHGKQKHFVQPKCYILLKN